MEHAPHKDLMVMMRKYFKTKLSPLLAVSFGRRQFVVTRNAVAKARIPLLTPEEADNLSAAPPGRLNVTRQPKSPANGSVTRPGQASLRSTECLSSRSEHPLGVCTQLLSQHKHKKRPSPSGGTVLMVRVQIHHLQLAALLVYL